MKEITFVNTCSVNLAASGKRIKLYIRMTSATEIFKLALALLRILAHLQRNHSANTV